MLQCLCHMALAEATWKTQKTQVQKYKTFCYHIKAACALKASKHFLLSAPWSSHNGLGIILFQFI